MVPQIKNAIFKRIDRDIISRVQTVRKAIFVWHFDILFSDTGHVFEKLKISEKNKFFSQKVAKGQIITFFNKLKLIVTYKEIV
jgi:hypothetical protein